MSLCAKLLGSSLKNAACLGRSYVTCTNGALASLLHPQQLSSYQLQQKRGKKFPIGNYTGKELWESVYGVSPTGLKRGRGRRLAKINQMDLNFGRKLGDGEAKLLYPGLNVQMNVIKGDELVRTPKIRARPDDMPIVIMKRKRKQRDMSVFRSPLSRGWTSTTTMGQKLTEKAGFEGFLTYVLSVKSVGHMTGTLGMKRTKTVLVVTGNQNGLVGLGKAHGMQVGGTVKLAQKRAQQHLVEVPLYEGHTLYHNMFSQYHKTFLFIKKRPEGAGVTAHRVITCICKCAGIENISVKTKGSTDMTHNVAKAFIDAISTQETHQELANRTKLHVVEIRREQNYLPKVIASPEGDGGKATGEKLSNEEEDITNRFDRYYMHGKSPYVATMNKMEYKKRYQFWSPQYKRQLKKKHIWRNQMDQLIKRRAGLW